MKKRKSIYVTVSATEAQRHFGEMLERAYSGDEHLIVERDGFPMAVIISFADYEEFMKERGLKAFEDFSHKFGQEVERRGITEEQLMEDLEETKKEVFREQYGNL